MPGTYNVVIPDAAYFEKQVLCREACPVHTDSGGYVQAIAEGRYEDAYILARKPNPFASICGRVCAAPCEAKCRRGALDASVSIRALKRFVCERFGVESDRFEMGNVYLGLNKTTATQDSLGAGKRVAIVGAGPAGLSCAHELALMGFKPTVFESQGVAGGMLVLGVPEYRLPRSIVQAEIKAIESLGVEIRLNTRLGSDFSLSDLKRQGYEAVFIGIGAHKSRDLAIEGVELDGVLRAIDFLLNVNLGYNVEFGRKVVVIGGGNVAFDVARSLMRESERSEDLSEAELRVVLRRAASALESLTRDESDVPQDVRLALDAARAAVRKGVPEVHMYCLEDTREIPAAQDEIDEAISEGIQMHTRWGPRRIVGSDGKVTGIELIRCSRVFDENRKFNPSFVDGSEHIVDCDTVVMAIGQAPDLSWIRPQDELALTERGALRTDTKTLATSRPDVFAGGDVAFGPRIIITAVEEGKRAAASIAQFLAGRVPVKKRRVRVTRYRRHAMPHGYERFSRHTPPALAIDRRIGVSEVEQAYREPVALEQAERCLKCHISPIFNGDTCILCGGCADVCPSNCLRLVDVAKLAGDHDFTSVVVARYGTSPVPGAHAAIIKDETACIRCGLCAERCPTGAVTMERIESVPA
ncbi:MAG: FAD-dependent oxidoreductase [Verrucomicrobia bacterium]|nr:FAD-dependent oxidoreductase [Verrucomicrobiota bacterium]